MLGALLMHKIYQNTPKLKKDPSHNESQKLDRGRSAMPLIYRFHFGLDVNFMINNPPEVEIKPGGIAQGAMQDAPSNIALTTENLDSYAVDLTNVPGRAVYALGIGFDGNMDDSFIFID